MIPFLKRKARRLKNINMVLVLTSLILLLSTQMLIHFLRNSNLDWGVFEDINKESSILAVLEEIFLVAGIALKLIFNDRVTPVFALVGKVTGGNRNIVKNDRKKIGL